MQGFQYAKLNDDGYVCILSSTPTGDGIQEPIEIPDDFMPEAMHCYRYEDGQLVYDPDMLARTRKADEEAEQARLAKEAADAAAVEELRVISRIAIMALARAGMLDEATIAEHASVLGLGAALGSKQQEDDVARISQ